MISALERCRDAARTFCERFDFPTSEVDELNGPPRDGPIALVRDDHLTDAYRWLGNGRGESIVQCEVDLVTGKLTVYGGYSHREFGPWEPPG